MAPGFKHHLNCVYKDAEILEHDPAARAYHHVQILHTRTEFAIELK
jgi:hypothetical protein